jgi:5-formyltetrahydrofolate cyclo-ligase
MNTLSQPLTLERTWHYRPVTTPNDDIRLQKIDLRKRVQVARNTLRTGATDTRASAFALNAMQFVKTYAKPGEVIALFVSFDYEPPTDMFISMLDEGGYKILLPRVVNEVELQWFRFDGQWSLDTMGINAPHQTSAHLDSASIICIPAFAASNDGRRLGRGKGFYDRQLQQVKPFEEGGPFRIAVTDIAGLIEPGVIPMDTFDQKVDAVLVG